MYFCKFLRNLSFPTNLIPSQEDMRSIWCVQLLSNGQKFKKKIYTI
jgi:hypothetical protein